jgi:hypothetical protein
MRRNLRFSVIAIITIIAVLMFSGCQEQTQTVKQTTIKPVPGEKYAPNKPHPVLIFDSNSLDFGKVGLGTVTAKELKFHNAGKSTLKISEVTQCCGFVIKMDKEQYEPNDTGILNIEFHATNTPGVVERKPVVISNDPKNPKITLIVKAEMIQKVEWEPKTLKLFLNEANAACPKLNIKSIDGQAFAVIGIRSTGNCITADYNPQLKQIEHTLDLKVNIEKLPKELYGKVEVLLNHPEGNLADVSFDVVPKFSFNPNIMIIYKVKANIPQKEKVKLINNYKENIGIESTSSKENNLKLIDYVTIKDGYELNLEITPPKNNNKELRFTDILYVNMKDGTQLALTCIGYYAD